jgi:hypothetical protein
MKTCRELDVDLHAFLFSAIFGRKWSDSQATAALPSRNETPVPIGQEVVPVKIWKPYFRRENYRYVFVFQ